MAQKSLEHVALASMRLIEARSHINEAHLGLRDAQFELGLGPVSYGDYGDTPVPAAQSGGLAVVQAA